MFWRNLPWMLVAGLAASIAYGCLASAAEPAKTREDGKKMVVEFRSKGAGRTVNFTVQDDWEIEWESKDGAASVGRDILVWDETLPRGSYKNPRYIIGGTKQSATYRMERGGTYSLRIMYGADDHRGIWRARIWQGTGQIDD